MEAPWIALVDDGELEDAREILCDLGAEFVHWGKVDAPKRNHEPSGLLVITGSLAAALDYRRRSGRDPSRAVWIAICESDSRSERQLILESGFDYRVARPVHPTALRMLIERALFSGEEQRERHRVAVGYEVTYRVGLRWCPATLLDLSPGGCRLLTKQAVDVGFRVTVSFPSEIAGTASFTHPGVVVRRERGLLRGGVEEEVVLGVRFAKFAPDVRDKIRGLLNQLSSGPPTLPREVATPSRPQPPEVDTPRKPSAAARPPKSSEKLGRTWPVQREPRGEYGGDVGIFGMAGCVLHGVDLSRNGLCVEPHPALAEGAEIRLVLPVKTGEPIVVGARVLRDDGERGVALRFSWVESGCEGRLAAMVDGLKEIQTLSPDEAGAEDVVLAKVVPTLLRKKGTANKA